MTPVKSTPCYTWSGKPFLGRCLTHGPEGGPATSRGLMGSGRSAAARWHDVLTISAFTSTCGLCVDVHGEHQPPWGGSWPLIGRVPSRPWREGCLPGPRVPLSPDSHRSCHLCSFSGFAGPLHGWLPPAPPEGKFLETSAGTVSAAALPAIEPQVYHLRMVWLSPEGRATPLIGPFCVP